MNRSTNESAYAEFSVLLATPAGAVDSVPCPRDCGWAWGDPVCDEDGLPYTCFCCYNEGSVARDWNNLSEVMA
jgi:hypothetical protein